LNDLDADDYQNALMYEEKEEPEVQELSDEEKTKIE
jgi:hypothetical protein